MKARVKWVEEVTFVGEAGSGHAVVMDGPPDHGGGPSQRRRGECELCHTTAFDVMMILKKARQQVEDCVVELEAERADEEPKVFTKIHAHFVITGNKLKEDRVKRAVELSAEKYCSASIMLGKTAEITHDYEIVESTHE